MVATCMLIIPALIAWNGRAPSILPLCTLGVAMLSLCVFEIAGRVPGQTHWVVFATTAESGSSEDEAWPASLAEIANIECEPSKEAHYGLGWTHGVRVITRRGRALHVANSLKPEDAMGLAVVLSEASEIREICRSSPERSNKPHRDGLVVRLTEALQRRIDAGIAHRRNARESQRTTAALRLLLRKQILLGLRHRVCRTNALQQSTDRLVLRVMKSMIVDSSFASYVDQSATIFFESRCRSPRWTSRRSGTCEPAHDGDSSGSSKRSGNPHAPVDPSRRSRHQTTSRSLGKVARRSLAAQMDEVENLQVRLIERKAVGNNFAENDTLRARCLHRDADFGGHEIGFRFSRLCRRSCHDKPPTSSV